MKIIFYIFLVSIIFSVAQSLKAQDLKAAEMRVINTSNLYKYKVQITFYRDIPNLVNRPFILLNWGDGTLSDTLFTGPPDASCGIPNTYGYYYDSEHTYSGIGNYIISCEDSFLVSNVMNISDSHKEKLRIEYHLSIIPALSGAGNNSPIFLNCTIDEWGYNWKHNSDAIDPDGDILKHSIVPTFTRNYVIPNHLEMDSLGTMVFSPIANGLYITGVRTDEWRMYNQQLVLIGSCMNVFGVHVNSVGITENHPQSIVFHVFPNPANDYLNIAWEAEFDFPIELKISDVSGRIIVHQTLKYQTGNTTLDVSSLANGIYTIQLLNNKTNVYEKFCKQQ